MSQSPVSGPPLSPFMVPAWTWVCVRMVDLRSVDRVPPARGGDVLGTVSSGGSPDRSSAKCDRWSPAATARCRTTTPSEIAADGRLVAVDALRWYGAEPGYLPWRTEVLEECEIAGVRLPCHLRGIKGTGTEHEHRFVEMRLTGVEPW